MPVSVSVLVLVSVYMSVYMPVYMPVSWFVYVSIPVSVFCLLCSHVKLV